MKEKYQLLDTMRRKSSCPLSHLKETPRQTQDSHSVLGNIWGPPQEEVESVTKDREVWANFHILMPPKIPQEMWKKSE